MLHFGPKKIIKKKSAVSWVLRPWYSNNSNKKKNIPEKPESEKDNTTFVHGVKNEIVKSINNFFFLQFNLKVH
jgi:hypothetical protein